MPLGMIPIGWIRIQPPVDAGKFQVHAQPLRRERRRMNLDDEHVEAGVNAGLDLNRLALEREHASQRAAPQLERLLSVGELGELRRLAVLGREVQRYSTE